MNACRVFHNFLGGVKKRIKTPHTDHLPMIQRTVDLHPFTDAIGRCRRRSWSVTATANLLLVYLQHCGEL